MEKFGKVLQNRVAARVRLAHLAEDLLPGTLRHDDHAVLLTVQHPSHVRQHPALALERGVNLRDQADVNLARRQRGVHGDEPRLPAHDSNQTDAVERGPGLDRGGPDRLDRLVHRGLKPEGSVQEQDVVVDRLGNANHRGGHVALAAHVVYGQRARVRTVAADDEEEVQVHIRDGVHDVARVAAAAGRAQDAPALQMDRLHQIGRQLDGLPQLTFLLEETPEAVPDALDIVHAVLLQRDRQLPDDVVQARAEAAASHDGRLHL